jgi:hypothetical protein
MARYEREFSGMPALFTSPRGLDPNFEDGYGGMRMSGGRGRAAYGAHRFGHRYDLETEGGFGGIHGGSAQRGYRRDPAWEAHGGVVDPYMGRRPLDDFNAMSPRYAGPRRYRYDSGMDDRQRHLPEPRWTPSRAYRSGYTNRGVTDAGYSEGWAFGPMRGSR